MSLKRRRGSSLGCEFLAKDNFLQVFYYCNIVVMINDSIIVILFIIGLDPLVMRQVNLALIWKPQIVNDFASLINPVCNIIVLCTFLGSLDLLVVGFCLTWRYPLNFVAVVAICCWLLQLFGSSSTTLVLFVVVIMVVLFLFQDVDIFTGEEKKTTQQISLTKISL